VSDDRRVPQHAIRSEDDGAELGGLPASEASVRARRARNSGDERGAASPRGALVSRPAKSQSARPTPDAGQAQIGSRTASTADGPSGPEADRDGSSDGARQAAARSLGAAAARSSIVEAKIISQRVDWLELAFQLDVSSDALERLKHAHEAADEAGCAEVHLSGLAFGVQRHRQRDLHRFENADLRASFDLRSLQSWCLSVVFRAVYLATHPFDSAMALALQLARGFGGVRDARLRRFDLAVDCTGLPLDSKMAERFATTRARLSEFRVEDKDCDAGRIQAHRNHRYAVTGFTIAPGNALSARVYDKSTELCIPGRESKRIIEHQRWRAGGWDGVAAVTRIEFQHRGTHLDKFGLRNPELVGVRSNECWQRDTQWLRLTVPGSSSRRTRWRTDPRWLVVGSASFESSATAPIQAGRQHRGGVTADHLRGTLLSRLGASGRLTRVLTAFRGDGMPLDDEAIDAMPDAQAQRQLRALHQALFDAACIDIDGQFIEVRGSRERLLALLKKARGVAARFSSADDKEGTA
jgi:hypothetical protein